MAVSRILSVGRGERDDHLSHRISSTPTAFSRSMMRPYPEIVSEFLRRIADRLSFSCLSCTAWGFSCRTNYFARGELLPRLFTLACTFSKNRRYYFCDTFHRRSFSTATSAFSTRHAAEWCSDFPLANLAT